MKVIAIILFSASLAGACPKPVEEKVAPLVIKAVGDKTFLNDLEFIHGQTTLVELEKILGPSRKGKSSRRRYFDAHGLTANLKGEGSIELINIHFSNEGELFKEKNLKRLFTGKVDFKGVEIKPDSKVDHLLKQFIEKKLAKPGAKYLPTTKLKKSAWWFYEVTKGIDKETRKPIRGNQLQMITLWIR